MSDLYRKPDLPLWHEAAALAARCHVGQIRKDGRTPYVAHPFRVAMIVRDVFGVDDPVVLAGALLHDVIEDSDTDYEDVMEACGREVADIVAAMSKDMRMVEAEREAAYDRQLAAASWKARLVKLADVYDNVRDAETDSGRAKTLSKAPRAIACAGDEPRLVKAVGLLRELVEVVTEK